MNRLAELPLIVWIISALGCLPFFIVLFRFPLFLCEILMCGSDLATRKVLGRIPTPPAILQERWDDEIMQELEDEANETGEFARYIDRIFGNDDDFYMWEREIRP